jgi:glycosyltransferase involved in cell wall biosynthesis
LAVVASHPIQYQGPLFRELARHPEVDLTVFFCSDHGAVESTDAAFGKRFRWDIPLLEGYRHEFLPNNSPRPGVDRGFWGELNLGLVSRIAGGRFDAVLVHGYAYASCWLAFLGAKLGRARLLLRADSNLLNRRSPLKRAIKRAVLPPTFAMMDTMLAVGSLNYEYYRHYGASPLKLVYAPFSVDNSCFEPTASLAESPRVAIRRSLGLPPDSPVALFCGKLVAKKRPLDFLQSLEGARSASRIHGLVVGDGELRGACEAYARGRLADRVVFAGFKNQSELPGLYAAADILVVPSEIEPWGLVVNEAMAAGLPAIVSTSVGAAPDLVRQGETGFTFPTGDVAALTRFLEEAVEPQRLARLGLGASRRIAAWSIADTIKGILRALGQECLREES